MFSGLRSWQNFSLGAQTLGILALCHLRAFGVLLVFSASLRMPLGFRRAFCAFVSAAVFGAFSFA